MAISGSGKLSRRARGIVWLASSAALAAVAWLGWAILVGAGHVETDNAYVHGDVVVVTPQVPGTVVAVHASETDRVERGALLVTLDDTDARHALQRRSMHLARVARETRAAYLNVGAFRARLEQREAETVRARAEARRAAESLARRELLQARGVVSLEDVENARTAHHVAASAVTAAEAGVASAREALQAHLAVVEGVSLERHPAIEAAAVEMREAWLELERMDIRAPVSGQIARRKVQVGQRVVPGADLLTVVPLDDLWIEANLKEDDLRRIRVGQKAWAVADAYGESVKFPARVVGVGAGTGAAFALLPPQNATGNWIKVVQRVPVRLAIDREQLARHPLRIGLSMRVRIDTSDAAPAVVEDGSKESPRGAETSIFDSLATGADEAVRRVIQRNLRPGADVGEGGISPSRTTQ